MSLAENIKKRRKALGLKQWEVGDIIGLDASSISKIERGETVTLKPAQLQALCKLFSCTPTDLYGIETVELTSTVPLTADMKELISIIPTLDDDKVKLLLDVIRAVHAGI